MGGAGVVGTMRLAVLPWPAAGCRGGLFVVFPEPIENKNQTNSDTNTQNQCQETYLNSHVPQGTGPAITFSIRAGRKAKINDFDAAVPISNLRYGYDSKMERKATKVSRKKEEIKRTSCRKKKM